MSFPSRAPILAVAVALLVGAAATACKSPLPRAAELAPHLDADLDLDLAALDRGRMEYVAKCSGCHPLYAPSRGDGAYWSEWTEKMARRSHLEPDQAERIVAYLTLASDAQRALGEVALDAR